MSQTSNKPDSKLANNIFKVVLAICVLLFLADFVYHKHPHFSFEKFPGFYAIFGFLAFAGLVFAAKAIRPLLTRREDYYDD